MDAGLTAAQLQLAAAAADALRRVCPPATVRAVTAADDPASAGRQLWRQLAAAGFTGVTIPDRQGGLGEGLAAAIAVIEQAGYAALPLPLAETLAAAWIIARSPDAGPRDLWLPPIAAGELAALVLLPDQELVAHAAAAGLFVVIDDAAVRAVPAGRTRVTALPRSATGRPLSRVAAGPEDGDSLGASPREAEIAAAAMTVANAAALVGLAGRMLDVTVGYVAQRRQFGRQVGSFQAIRHRLADARTALDIARPAVAAAAAALDADMADAALESAVAAAVAAQAHATVSEHALHCHGGIGFTAEHDLHLWLTQGKNRERAYRSARQNRARIAEAVLGPLHHHTDERGARS